MADLSSSSNSSSSSSIDSRSSMSTSSSSSKSLSSSSSSSSFSSSSSSIDSSSSSSSSLFDRNETEIIGFKFTSELPHKINGFDFHNEYCFCCADGDSCVIRSKNRFHWEKYFETENTNVLTIKIFDGNLFVGSSPNGNVFRINVDTNSSKTISLEGNIAFRFFIINNALYVACQNKPYVYKYDSALEKFDFIYEAHANINDISVWNNVAILALDSGNPICFDGENWSLLFTKNTSKDNIASIRKIKQDPFYNIEFNFLNRELYTDNTSSIKDMYVFPYRRNIGIKSVSFFENNMFFGGKTYGRIISARLNETPVTIFDTDTFPVHCITNIDAKTILASIGNKLYIGYNGGFSSYSDDSQSDSQSDSSSSNTKDERWNFIPVLHFKDEYVSSMSIDENKSQILIGTSKGRILATSNIGLNAYCTGKTNIYGIATNEFGISSEKQETEMMYALSNRIASIESNKEINSYTIVKQATIYPNQNITGVFISPIINVKNDLGFWKNIIWEQDSDNSDVVLYLRAADTIEALYMQRWSRGFRAAREEENPITRSLIGENINGRLLQIKVEITNKSNNIENSVSSVSVGYSTKNAVYFFTTRFSMNNGSDLSKGIITANITRPKNTEIIFGITDKNTTEWNDYTIIEQDKFFDSEKIENLKIGLKMISYDDTLPEVHEFSILMSGNKTNTLNLQ